MAKVKGEAVYVSVWKTDAYILVGGQKDATIAISQEPIDETSKDSAGWNEKGLGNREMTVDFDAFLIEDDAGWLELKKGLINGAGDHQKCKCQVDTPAYRFNGNFVMSGLSLAGPQKDDASVSFSLISDGQITETAK